MSKKIIFVVVVILGIVLATIIFNISKIINKQNGDLNDVSPEHEIYTFYETYTPESVKCLARVNRNISICDVETSVRSDEYMETCKEDYYFLVGIIDGEKGLCDMINDNNIKDSCSAIVLKDENKLPSEFCNTKLEACEYLKNNGMKIDEGFCDVAMNTIMGKQECKAIIMKDETLCFE
mgnify:CR=1 FL=1